jgi:hypothetical protein
MKFSLRSPSPFAALLLIATLAACERKSEPDPGNSVAPAKEEDRPLKLPAAIPTPSPELDRAALLTAVARAASAYAAGQDDREAQAELAGRGFTLKIRFGCGGAAANAELGAMGWRYDEEEQRLTIRARPDIDAENATLKGLPEGAVEAVEGFWIPQPWLLTDACPAQPAAPGAAPATPSVGIAHYFTADDSRVQRRSERSYEIVRRADPAILPPAGGFNLVLAGRLEAWPQAGVIRCGGSGGAARPVCIVSAEFDRVAFENPETGQTVAQWSAG